MHLLPLGLNLDGSLPLQTALSSKLRETADLRAEESSLRLWADPKALDRVRRSVKELRKKYPQPWLTFLGSGDFHHMTLLLLETLVKEKDGVTLILIDNHPDWFTNGSPFHCGNWVSGLKKIPGITSAVLIGQDSGDLNGWNFWVMPFREFCEGKLRLFPYQKKKVSIPFRWPAQVKGAAKAVRRLYGTELHFHTVSEQNPKIFFDHLASSLKGKNFYISIDKDCLNEREVVTDWEQGQLSVEDLLYGIRKFLEAGNLIGADVCGEKAPRPLEGFLKRLDAGRWGSPLEAKETRPLNEKTNLKILEAFETEPLAQSI